MRSAVLLSLLWAVILAFPWWAQGKQFSASDYLYQTSTLYRADFQPQNADLLDNPLFYVPSELFMAKSLKAGRMPFWNPAYYAGVPAFSDGQSGYFYLPRILLLWLLPVELVWHLSLFGHLFLSGVAAYALARQRGLAQNPALLVGTAWMLNGPCATWLEMDFLNVLNLWLPMCLLSLRNAAVSRRWVVVAAFSLLGLLTGGHLQWVLYACLVILFDVGRDGGAWRRSLMSGLLGLCLASPLLLPTIAQLRTSQRADRTPEFLQSTYRQYLQTVAPTLIMPDAWGSPVNGLEFRRISGYGNFIYPELCIFCGNGVILLALMGLVADARARRWAALGAVALLIPATPLYPWLALLIPGLTKIVPTRLGWPICLALIGLAGIGMQAWESGRVSLPARRILGGAALLAAASLLCWVAYQHNRAWEPSLLRLPDPETFLSLERYQAAARSGFERSFGWSSLSVWPHLLALVLLAGLVQLDSPRARRAVIALVAAEMLLFSLRFNPVQDGLFYPDNLVARKIATVAGGERCIGLSTIKPNQFAAFGVNVLEGYTSFYPGGTARVMGDLAGQPPQAPRRSSYGQISRIGSPWLNLLNVGYVLALPGQKPLASWEAKPLNPLVLYRNPARLALVRVVGETVVEPDPDRAVELVEKGLVDSRRLAVVAAPVGDLGGSGTATIITGREGGLRLPTSSSPPRDAQDDRVEVWAHVEGRALLVLADSYSPGWTVEVDGVAQPIVLCDVMLRGVVLAAGDHRVTFSYRPPGFELGLGLAGPASLVCLGLLSYRARLEMSR